DLGSAGPAEFGDARGVGPQNLGAPRWCVVAVLRAPVDAAQQVDRLVPGGHE
ncbi:unnamed protein product, partial [Effrenium voratum]